ncbi:MAG: hypothetical protein MI921_24765 [Cytophagales bacterium]|nr:hypothetical protein [Cytophagales bacterium]
MNSSNEKLACKISGLIISIFITGMLLILLTNADHYSVSTWIAFFMAILGLVALNIVYLNLIENVFRKLNHKN